MRYKGLLLLQLLLIVILSGYIAYSKRSILKAWVTPKLERIDTAAQLAAMNRTAIPFFVDTVNENKGEPFKLLIIGNSLAYHGIAKEIGWHHVGGMAATSISKDYAHLLYKELQDLLPDRRLSMRVSNLADFERSFSSYDLLVVDTLADFKADVIVFQLGENVSFDKSNTPAIFKEKYTALINRLQNGRKPIIICTTPFFPSAEKSQIVEAVALQTGSYVVDLSHLSLLEKESLAKDEVGYALDRGKWKVDGIGIHPGDKGMQSISRQLFIPLKATIAK